MEVISTLGRLEMPKMNASGSPPIFAGRVREEEMDFPARIAISNSWLLKRQGILAGNPGQFPGNPFLHGRVALSTHGSYYDNTTTASSFHGSGLPNLIGFLFYFFPGSALSPPPPNLLPECPGRGG